MLRLEPPTYHEDWRQILRRELKRMGFADAATVETTDHRSLELIYFAAMVRRIERRPRRVHESRRFKVTGALHKSYYALRHKIKQGEDLRPHQSSRILSAAASDELLSRWGIQHLHLGCWMQDNGLVARTGPLLFCILEPNDAYLIALEPHGHNQRPPWNDTRHLNTVVENWPHLFRQFAVNESSTTVVNSDRCCAVATAADEGSGCITLADGNTYLPWGGGVEADGTSAKSVELAGCFEERIGAAEAATTAAFESFLAVAQATGLSLSERVVFRLHVAERLYARLDGTNWAWCLEPAEPPVLVDIKTGRYFTSAQN